MCSRFYFWLDDNNRHDFRWDSWGFFFDLHWNFLLIYYRSIIVVRSYLANHTINIALEVFSVKFKPFILQINGQMKHKIHKTFFCFDCRIDCTFNLAVKISSFVAYPLFELCTTLAIDFIGMLHYPFELLSDFERSIHQITNRVIWKISQFIDDVLLPALLVVDLVKTEQTKNYQKCDKTPP
jgi:hypothetical protein